MGRSPKQRVFYVNNPYTDHYRAVATHLALKLACRRQNWRGYIWDPAHRLRDIQIEPERTSWGSIDWRIIQSGPSPRRELIVLSPPFRGLRYGGKKSRSQWREEALSDERFSVVAVHLEDPSLNHSSRIVTPRRFDGLKPKSRDDTVLTLYLEAIDVVEWIENFRAV